MLSDRLLEPHEIGRVFSDVLRINGHGELINDTHYRNICAIAEANPHTLVVLWTRAHHLGSKLSQTQTQKRFIVSICFAQQHPHITQRTLDSVLGWWQCHA